MGFFSRKYDLEKYQHDTLFYGNINTAKAIVCKVTNGIKWGQQKFHWVVIGDISGTDETYRTRCCKVCDVVSNILAKSQLNIVPENEPKDDDFWYVPLGGSSDRVLPFKNVLKIAPVSCKKFLAQIQIQYCPADYKFLNVLGRGWMLKLKE